MITTGQHVSREVRDWLSGLASKLPGSAPRADGTRLDRGDLIEEIGEFFAHRMSTGPGYSRSVVRHVQNAVNWFARGDGDLADSAICSAYEALHRAA